MAIKYYSNLINGLPHETKFQPYSINWEAFPSETDKSHFKKGTLTLRDYINSSFGSGSQPQYDFKPGETPSEDKTFLYLRDKSLTLAEKSAITNTVQKRLDKEVKEQLNNLSDDLILEEIQKGTKSSDQSENT